MKPSFLPLVFIVGLATGWWLRGEQDSVPVALPKSVQNAPAFAVAHPDPVLAAGDTAITRSTATNGEAISFPVLLHAQRFATATEYYYKALDGAPERLHSLRNEFDRYVEECLRTCQAEQFMNLAETWLDTFYDDIPVLVSLARFQSMQAQPEAAANTLLLAKTYALAGAEQRTVLRAIEQLAEETDSLLSRERRWIELLGFYEFLFELGLGGNETRLRQAQLHKTIGERSRSERIARSLLASDTGAEPGWTAALKDLLSLERATETIPTATTANALPLDRRGDHYLIDIELNDVSALTLMIDTGASVTTVSSERFRTLPRQDFVLLGSRIFNTASGYARGDVYTARSLRIGPHRLENLVIAVLPYQLEGDADGLLGMDVLRYFRFEIDQDRAALLLEPRTKSKRKDISD